MYTISLQRLDQLINLNRITLNDLQKSYLQNRLSQNITHITLPNPLKKPLNTPFLTIQCFEQSQYFQKPEKLLKNTQHTLKNQCIAIKTSLHK